MVDSSQKHVRPCISIKWPPPPLKITQLWSVKSPCTLILGRRNFLCRFVWNCLMGQWTIPFLNLVCSSKDWNKKNTKKIQKYCKIIGLSKVAYAFIIFRSRPSNFLVAQSVCEWMGISRGWAARCSLECATFADTAKLYLLSALS